MPISQTGARMDTEAYEYLNEWREVSLTSVADIRFSSVNKVSQPGEEPVRLCNYTDVYNNDYVTADMDFMRATATKSEIERFGLQVGDVIITKDSETPDDIGIPTVVDTTAPDLVCGYHLALLRPNQDEVDPTFLAKQLAHHRIARYFGQQANGTTRYGLSTAAIANAPLHLPRPENQRSASALMRMVDAQIAQTKAVIAKLTQVRAGMLHDLLSYGLDEHGQLRDPIAHPEQFQDSPLGRIPINWDVGPFSEIANVNPPTPATGLSPFNFISFIPMQDVDEEGNWVYRQTRKLINCSGGYTPFTEGDVLFAKITPCMENGKGCHAIDLVNGFGMGSTEFHVLRPKSNTSARFVFHWSLTKSMRIRALAYMTGSAGQQRVEAGFFNYFLIPIPPTHEQGLIANVIDGADSKIEASRNELKKLKTLKSGLQDDLLTGRVRVPETIMEGAENA
jgi:type I restriction enzyme S subunit